MAQNLIDLRRRIRAVKDTQKTTQAMKTVSAVKLSRSARELKRTGPMMEKIESLLKRAGKAPDIKREIGEHPFLQARSRGCTIIVAVSADKGLCGGFNSRLIENTETHYQDRLDREGSENISLITVGNKAYKHFSKRNYPIKKNYPSVMARLQYRHARDLSEYLQELYLNPDENIKTIEFTFMEFVSASRQEITTRKLFPIKIMPEEEGGEDDIEYIFEPSAGEIFKALLPKYINSTVYQILLQSSASEHAARMVAMDLATRNASDMIRSLTLTMNKLRQASITGELLEIITATEALKRE